MTKEIRYFQSYLSLNKNLSNKTIEAYSSDILMFERYLHQNTKNTLRNAFNEQINNYFATLNVKESTFNRKITAISEFYKYLLTEKYSINVKIDKIKHIKLDKVYPKIIKKDDIFKMIKVQENSLTGQRNVAIIMLLYITGLRVSELCNLSYSDINFEEGYIRCIGKGNKEKIIACGELLSITLSKYTHEIRPKILNGLISDYVFVNTEGEPLRRQTIYNIISNSAKLADIKLKVTPHTIRHCFATHMLENGADIRSVQEMLGHSDISTTQIYLNIANKTLKESYFAKFIDPLKEEKNMKFKRAFVIVCDSMGIGNAKDAKKYNDEGSNTFKHIDEHYNLNVPQLYSLGLDRICDVKPSNIKMDHSYALALNEASLGKDTLTGHYELMGLKVDVPFKTFTETGFPDELISQLEKLWGRKIAGNKSASGTEIIKELGEHHMKTGDVIVYTSSDSVLQICAHEDIIPVEKLYEMCEQAREITKDDKYKLGRIIARPFVGTCAEDFKRTPRRHDYALKPFAKTMLNILQEAKYDVISIGKIVDIFVNEGITEYYKIVSNNDGCEKIIDCMKKDFTGLCFANLVDFDMEYGHRRNVEGYGKAIEDFDKYVEKFKELLNEDDIMFITADHGNDPTWHGSDHTREKVPLLIYSKAFKETGVLEDEDTFASLSSTLADIFNVKNTGIGNSILKKLK